MSNVTVEINGRETVSQAALEAKKGISGLSSSAQQAQKDAAALGQETGNLKNMFGGFVITAGDVVNAVQSIAKAVYSTVEAFAEQEKSIKQFDAAMSLSKNITKDGANALRAYAEEVALLTGQDDEAILSMEAFLASAGRNENQIKKLITVAADYSAATGKDMRTSVETLNKTFSGTAERLSTVIPALKDLTDEQLKAGKGIDVVGQQYAGFATQMSAIADIDLKNFKNAYEDVIAELGKAVYPAIGPAIQAVTAWMNETLIPGIGEVFDVLVAVFKNLPAIAQESFSTVLMIIRRAFEWRTMVDIIKSFGQFFVDAIANALAAVPRIFAKLLEALYTPVLEFGKYLKDVILGAFSGDMSNIPGPGKFFAGVLEKEVGIASELLSTGADYYSKAWENVSYLASDLGKPFAGATTDEQGRSFADRIAAILKPTLDAIKNAKGSGTVLGGGGGGTVASAPSTFVAAAADDFYLFMKSLNSATVAVDSFATQAESGTLIVSVPEESPGGLAARIAEIWAERPAPDQVGIGAAAEEAVANMYGFGIPENQGPSDDYYLYQQSFGQAPAAEAPRNLALEEALASNIATRQESPIEAFLTNAIMPLVDGFMGLINPLASVQEILNPLQTIFSAMMEVLGPLINTVLQPIVGILRVVGTALGQILVPVISALGPIISLVADAFIWLYNNAIRPVANAFIWVGNAIYNAIVWAINKIKSIWGGEQIAYRSLDSGYLTEIDSSALTAAGSTSYGGTTGASASYQRQRDITVNVAVQTSALVGDDGISQFALIIGRELKAAGVLGAA